MVIIQNVDRSDLRKGLLQLRAEGRCLVPERRRKLGSDAVGDVPCDVAPPRHVIMSEVVNKYDVQQQNTTRYETYYVRCLCSFVALFEQRDILRCDAVRANRKGSGPGQRLSLESFTESLYVCIYIYIYICCIYTYTHTHVYMHAYIYIRHAYVKVPDMKVWMEHSNPLVPVVPFHPLRTHAS